MVLGDLGMRLFGHLPFINGVQYGSQVLPLGNYPE